MGKSFSERMGLVPAKAIQLNDMDDALRTKLWSVLHEHLFAIRNVRNIWVDHFAWPGDQFKVTRTAVRPECISAIREHYFKLEWWEVYDLLEFVLDAADKWMDVAMKCERINEVLEAECSGYRLSRLAFHPISDRTELGAIDESLQSPYAAGREHLATAITLLSKRPQGDYRNAVKEAISAVESVAREASGNPKGKLSDCIDTIASKLGTHKALLNGWKQIYGYTSDAGGIRHALNDGDRTPTFGEAKYMIVICSAFVNMMACVNPS